ncbi:MAG: DNA methylase, partial [Nitrospirales bacterium]|nr:DNA methylase [Nitrospirales bacterium]
HRLFAIEYHCPACKRRSKGRFFKKPDSHDLAGVAEAEARWLKTSPSWVPDDEIPSGDETSRLHRWGYRLYREMFNPRQLLGLELSAEAIASVADEAVRHALATNLSDLLRYQNMLCRYDTVALKSLDIFSVHGFPVGLVQCESNLLGIWDKERRLCVGSGGWVNIIEKFRKAKAYCDEPFEMRSRGGRKEIVPITGEWIGAHRLGKTGQDRQVSIRCEDSSAVELLPRSLDAVLTDPPYFGNVQYAELMDFCYVWLRRLVGTTTPAFGARTTRNPRELTGNEAMKRGLEHFTEGLSSVFRRMAKALKQGAPLAFTYHHNDLKAYYPLAVALLDSGLTCSASLPCPAEMGASIHISGTGSSIIDTVFVCRSDGVVPKSWIVDSAAGVAQLVKEDMRSLRLGKVSPTPGDVRCIAYGHLIRLAVWYLRRGWDGEKATACRIARVAEWLQAFGGWQAVEREMKKGRAPRAEASGLFTRENLEEYGTEYANLPL